MFPAMTARAITVRCRTSRMIRMTRALRTNSMSWTTRRISSCRTRRRLRSSTRHSISSGCDCPMTYESLIQPLTRKLMMRHRQYAHSGVALSLAALLALAAPARAQVEIRWMAVGSLNHWFASTGHEIEEGRVSVQQDGLQWPAYYKYQDMEAASGLWLGVTNWTDQGGTTWLQKVVHVGPRVNGLGE